MTDVLFSLSFSLKWRKEKSISEFERNSPPTKKRETHDYFTRTHLKTLGKKKANLKRVPFSLSLFFSLFQRRRERMNQQQQQQQQQHLLYKSTGERDSFSSFFSFFCFFCVALELRTPLVFLCVSVVCSFLFFFLSHTKKTPMKKQFTHEPSKRESLSFLLFLLVFCVSFA